jgi:hypothetical protein
MRLVFFAIVAATLLSVQGRAQVADSAHSRKEKGVSVLDRCFPKGGFGFIREGLYIDVDSAKNELRLNGKNTWTGKDRGTKEVVFVFEGRIWPPPSLPDGFDLSKVVVISFEGSIVRFVDFDKMSGGYYRRNPAK